MLCMPPAAPEGPSHPLPSPHPDQACSKAPRAPGAEAPRDGCRQPPVPVPGVQV